MIAHAAPAVAVADADAHREFEVIFPALQARLRRRFRRYRPDHREEHLADATAMAWLMFLSATRRGKDFTVNTLANYAARAILAGRRVAGYTDLDALSETPRARSRIGGHVSLDSLTTTTGFCQTFGDRTWRWPVVDFVAPLLDFRTFLSACDGRDKRIIELKLDGLQQKDIAQDLGVSPSAVCLRLRAMRRRWDPQPVA